MSCRLCRKTCPRRGSSGAEATIQPALVDTAELFDNPTAGIQPTGNGHTSPAQPSSSAPAAAGATTPGSASGPTSSHSPPLPMMEPARLEASLDVAHKRVVAADKQVASANTDEEFSVATSALETAVGDLEKITDFARRCYAVSKALLSFLERTMTDDDDERDRKRPRIDHQMRASNPPVLTLNEVTTNTVSDAVDGADVDRDVKENIPVE